MSREFVVSAMHMADTVATALRVLANELDAGTYQAVTAVVVFAEEDPQRLARHVVFTDGVGRFHYDAPGHGAAMNDHARAILARAASMETL